LRSTLLLYGRDRKILSTLTPEPGRVFCPVWSPDGTRIAFGRMTALRPAVNVKNADGSGEIRALSPGTPDAELPSSWSPDGKTIAYTKNYAADRSPTRKALSADIWLVPADGSSPPRPWFETPFRESSPIFSPDGRWIAYVSDESGLSEVYVRPYPGPGAAIKVSTEPGFEPVWCRGGRELIYRAGTKSERFLAVEFAFPTDGPPSISTPRLVLTSEVDVGGQWQVGTRDTAFREYDVSADGNEFFMTRRNRTAEPERLLRVVTNWTSTIAP